jgi:predicted restriction endonuclease
VTSYDASEALEAAHIVPYRGPVTNHPSNGLLLRADLHSLFDLGLVAVDTTSELRLLVSKEIERTSYAQMKGSVLSVPDDPALYPSLEALKQHRDWASI